MTQSVLKERGEILQQKKRRREKKQTTEDKKHFIIKMERKATAK
jgi:hypothetical protein